MRKGDLVDLRVDMAHVLEAIGALEATDGYWAAESGEIPNSLPEMGRLRMRLWALSQTIIRAKRMGHEEIFRR